MNCIIYLFVVLQICAPNKIKWGKAQDDAFEILRDKIKNIGLLYHPTDDDTFLVQTDASQHAISGVLYQLQYDPQLKCNQWKLIEFYSKQIDQHLQKHHISVLECLAISYALNHWKHFLLRKKFFLDTDHRNLVSLYDVDVNKAPNMKKQQIFKTLQDATAMFHFELAHLEGKNLILADYLSRDGSKNNSIDDTTRGIKLVNIAISKEQSVFNINKNCSENLSNVQYRVKYKSMLNKIVATRTKIFSDAHDDWTDVDKLDPIVKNAYSLVQTDSNSTSKATIDNQISIDHFDHIYQQEHGYVHSCY